MRYCKNCSMRISLPQTDILEEGECEICEEKKPCMNLPSVKLSRRDMKEAKQKMSLKNGKSK